MLLPSTADVATHGQGEAQMSVAVDPLEPPGLASSPGPAVFSLLFLLALWFAASCHGHQRERVTGTGPPAPPAAPGQGLSTAWTVGDKAGKGQTQVLLVALWSARVPSGRGPGWSLCPLLAAPRRRGPQPSPGLCTDLPLCHFPGWETGVQGWPWRWTLRSEKDRGQLGVPRTCLSRWGRGDQALGICALQLLSFLHRQGTGRGWCLHS